MSRSPKRSAPPIHRAKNRNSSDCGFYNPFADLDQHLKRVRKNESRRPEPAPPLERMPEPDPLRDDELFLEAMADVNPMDRGDSRRVERIGPSRLAPREALDDDEEVYAHLEALVNGSARFDLTCTDEYIEGAVVGISPDIVKKLRGGEFSYQDYVDLHGLTRAEAGQLVRRFIRWSYYRRRRCVLIVPGRGLNSKDKKPVLKEALGEWLTRAPLKRLVLAFASARSYDGGLGAVYVLLRRYHKKSPIVSPLA